MAVSDWSTTASTNTTIGGINIAENCPAGNLNNAEREMMAQLRSVMTDAVLSIMSKATVGEIRTALDALEATAAVEAIGALTPAADRVPYYTGASTAALATLSAFIRTLLDDADASTARSTIGAIGVASSALANPGHIRFTLPGTSSVFQIAFGTFTSAANTSTVVTYQTAFPNASYPVASGAGTGAGAQDNWPAVNASTVSNFTVFSAADASVPCWYIAVGY